jgi:signal transduction histidine kinase
MRIKAVESRARLAIGLFFIGILSTVGLSLVSYLRTSSELSDQFAMQTRLQATLLSSVLAQEKGGISSTTIADNLHRHGIAAAVAVFGSDGGLVAQGSTLAEELRPDLLSPQLLLPALLQGSTGPVLPVQSPLETRLRTDLGLTIVESRVGRSKVMVLATHTEATPLPTVFYVLTYQVLGLALGLGLIVLIVRWLLRPYKRMVEAAHGSPIHAASALSESEFVVETFQALIGQLQAKEKELAELHSIERRRAEKSERFSERLIASIPSGLVVVNYAGIVTSTNLHATEIFGMPDPGPEDAPGEDSGDGTREDPDHNAGDGNLQPVSIDFRLFFKHAPRMVSLISDCLSRSISFRREEVDIIRPDGQARHLGFSISPITDPQHNVEGALCLITDITEVIELRERMKLQESLANLGEMAAGLAHEFKNSLATIQGYVQLLDAAATGNRRSAIHSATNAAQEAILNEVRLLANLVTDFLNFSRPQQPALLDTDLRRVLEDSADEIRPNLEDSGIELRIEGLFANLLADEAMLRRAFSNLLRNAAEAIDRNAEAKMVTITGSIDPGTGSRYAHIRIRDTGTGIRAENLQRVFIPFFTTKSRGYGIGLALVQKILVAHGGGVSIEKSDESGTIFHCRLPLAPISTVKRITQAVT